MNKLQNAGIMLGAVALAASTLGASLTASAHGAKEATYAGSYAFTSIVSPGDPTFTQLLGINKAGAIVGYFGSGADGQHPNKGFLLGLPSTYVAENYPKSAQTQVIGINNNGDTAGFYVDSAGATHGFTSSKGAYVTVDVPGATFNQLLSINNQGDQAGYYQYGPSSASIFVPFVHHANGSFTLLPIANAQATSLNDHGLVGGFFNDSTGNSHGFLWQSGPALTIDYPTSVSTQVLGLNNLNQVVGTYTDSKKVAHGFVYNWQAKSFSTVDVPGSSATVVNGINRLGWLVGFYTDSKGNTVGFVAKPGSH